MYGTTNRKNIDGEYVRYSKAVCVRSSYFITFFYPMKKKHD